MRPLPHYHHFQDPNKRERGGNGPQPPSPRELVFSSLAKTSTRAAMILRRATGLLRSPLGGSSRLRVSTPSAALRIRHPRPGRSAQASSSAPSRFSQEAQPLRRVGCDQGVPGVTGSVSEPSKGHHTNACGRRVSLIAKLQGTSHGCGHVVHQYPHAAISHAAPGRDTPQGRPKRRAAARPQD